jgi:hypothetical protein
MIAFCRISQPATGTPSLVASSGQLEGVANPEPGIYHVSLAGGYGLTGPVNLQATGTKPGVTAAAEVAQTPEGAYYVAVYRAAGGQSQNGDVWLSVAGIEEIS